LPYLRGAGTIGTGGRRIEKALVLDDEDVAARAGLCEAHLKLGDMAFSKGRIQDAIQSTSACWKSTPSTRSPSTHGRDLSPAREKGPGRWRDEETLNAFLEALKYTPEDPALIEQFEKFKAEKKAGYSPPRR